MDHAVPVDRQSKTIDGQGLSMELNGRCDASRGLIAAGVAGLGRDGE